MIRRFRFPQIVHRRETIMHRRHLSHVLLLVAALLVAGPAPAVVGQETDTAMLPAGIQGEVLAEVEIPADALPTGETAAMLARFTWKAHTADAVPAGTFEKGILVDVVMEGSYALRSGGPLHVIREGVDGPPEQFAAGEEAVLATGDAVLYLDNDASWDFRNSAPSQPGTALEVLIISTDPPALPVESVVDPEHVDEDPSLHLEVLGRVEPEIWGNGAGGPLLVTIWRAELAPGASIPAPAAGIVQVVAAESGEAPDLTISPDGTAQNNGQDAIAIVGFTTAPA
jgi:hypothetical protein